MTAQKNNRDDLKEKFKQGAIPSGEDFEILINSNLNLAETSIETLSGSLQVEGDLVVKGDRVSVGSSTSSLNVSGELTVGIDRLVVNSSGVSIGNASSTEVFKVHENRLVVNDSGVSIGNFLSTSPLSVSGDLTVGGDRLVVNSSSVSIGTSTELNVTSGDLTVGGDRLVVDNSRSSVSIGTSTSAEPVNLYVSGDLRVRGTIHPEIEDTSTEPANLNVTGDLTVSNKLIQVKKYTISAGNTEKQTDYQVLEWICVIAGFDFQSSSKKNQVTQLSVYTEKDGDIWKIRANSMYPNKTVEVWVMAISTKIAEFIDA